jgi:hypothetical protein
MLQVEGKKMSKSLGNFFTVRDLLEQGWPGEVIRFVLLSTHYGSPVDWRRKAVSEAETILRKWRTVLEEDNGKGAVDSRVLLAIADDLNTPLAISVLHELYRAGSYASLKASARVLGLLDDGFGNWQTPTMSAGADEIIEGLFQKRQLLRSAGNFAASDFVRSAMEVSGIVVTDGKSPSWRPSYAGRDRGWMRLYDFAAQQRWVDTSTLDDLAFSQGIQVASKVDQAGNVGDGWVVVGGSVPREVNLELLRNLMNGFENA